MIWDIPAGRRVERLFGNQAQTDGGLRHTAKRGALHSGVQDRQGSEGGERRHERRDGACAVRLHLYARNGRERPERGAWLSIISIRRGRLSDLQQRDGRGVRAGNEIAKHFAGNNVDVIIYAVEKSLDSYKFNLLHCKQTFISQLKSGAMGARTIDEGAMDEKSGMNFSEYMALLSGNTDLLDKAKLEKRIASLEGERKSFNKGKRDSEFKLESKTGELRNNTAFIDAMTEDWNRFLSVVQTDKEGNRLNIIKVDGVDSADEKVIGKRLQEIAKNATTGGLYTQVGELYGFPIKVVSERILKEGSEFTDNRFVVEGTTSTPTTTGIWRWLTRWPPPELPQRD